MKRIVYLLAIILALELVSGAILRGSIYDTDLNKLNDVVVEINSTPPQVFLSKEGQYSFVLDPGAYEITAKYQLSGSNYLYTSSNVTLTRNGYFVVDLFLTPARRVSPTTGAVIGAKGDGPNLFILLSSLSAVLLLSLGFSVYKYKFGRKEDPGLDDQIDSVMDVIKKEGGRMTQKDIRKKIPLSESKVSLMITELENKGLIKKIKKGKGNVIVINKI
jgi:uncharacterized membrane protein